MKPFPRPMPKNCAVREITADGRNVGRCCFYVGDDNVCPRHGRVADVQQHYVETGELTDERKLPPRKIAR